MISMSEAATSLELLCDDIENTEDLTQAIQDLFKEKQEHLVEAVDRRIKYLEYAKMQIVHANAMAGQWMKRGEAMERLLDKMEQDTLAVIKASPVPMKGRLGKLRAQKNSNPRLIVDETDEDLVLFYTREKIIKYLDKAAIKEDMQNGIVIKSARLEYGEHLRY